MVQFEKVVYPYFLVKYQPSVVLVGRRGILAYFFNFVLFVGGLSVVGVEG